MKKYRFYLNFDKEEAWLNEMAQKGYLLTRRTIWGTYCFAKIVPADLNYRIDFRQFNRRADFAEYVQLFVDSGWKHLYGTKNSGSQYFIAEQQNAQKDIFSDSSSKAGRYSRLSAIWMSLVVCYTLTFLISLYRDTTVFYHLFKPKEWYLTPGLWAKTGADFWRAFWFETPFALMRGTSWLIYLVIFLASIYFAIRCILESKKAKKQAGI